MHVVPGQNLRCRQSLVYATSAAYNHSVIFLASAQPMSLAERKLKCIWIEHCRFSAHDSQINKFAVAFHNPFHDGEHLLRAGNINDLQVADGVKCSDVVVAHVGGAVRTCLKICCGGQECNIQSVAFTEPTSIMLASATPTFSARCWSTSATPASSPLVVPRSESIETTLESRANTFMAAVTTSAALYDLAGSIFSKLSGLYRMRLSRSGTRSVSTGPIFERAEASPLVPVISRCMRRAASINC